MRYELDSNGYILNVYEGCYSGSCIEYTGTTPTGYSSLDDWMDNANIRAYKIVDGNLAYDANKDAELQKEYSEEQKQNNPATQSYVETLFSKSNSIITDELSKNIEGSSFVYINDSGDYEIPNIKLTSTSSINDTIQLISSNKNMLSNKAITTTISGVKFTINQDRSITLNGTSTASIEFVLDGTSTSTDMLFLLKANTNFVKSGLATNVNLNLYNYNGTTRTLVNSGGNGVIMLSSASKITNATLTIASGKAFSNVTIKPQLELGDVATTYIEHQENRLNIDLDDFTLEASDYIEINNNTIHLFKSSGLCAYLGEYEELNSYSTTTIIMNDKGVNASVNYFTYKYITTQLNSITNDVSGLTLSVTSNTNDITNLNADVGTLSSDVNTLDTNVGTLSTNVGTLSTNVGTLSSSVKTLQGQVVTINKDYVKFTDLSTSGSTKINGDNITTGNIKSSNYVADKTGTKIDLTNGQMNINDDGSTEISTANLTIGSTKSGNYISSRGIKINDEETDVVTEVGKNGLGATWKTNLTGELNEFVDHVSDLSTTREATHYKPGTKKGEKVEIYACENDARIVLSKFTANSYNGTHTITSKTEITDNGIAINGKSIIDIIYPIGSIYMSVNSTSPATLFGGTWLQINGRFLLGQGNNGDGTTYANGATGGEKTHKLTLNEIPNDIARTKIISGSAWSLGVWKNNGQTSDAWSAQLTGQNNVGSGDAAHNNMPPYLVVYMWKRTA